MLSKWCEVNHFLHNGQVGSQRQKNSIDAIARLLNRVQQAWAEGKITGMLLINIKEAFDHISWNYLPLIM